MNFQFQKRVLDTMVGGVSALDIPRLDINGLEKAHNFILSYGYDYQNRKDRERLWGIHRRAVTLLRENLIQEEETLPEMLTDQNQLRDLGYLLIYASDDDRGHNEMQKWACAILRVMHVIVHLKHDLSRSFLETIQNQVLNPIRSHIYEDPVLGGTFLRGDGGESIKLYRFDVKPLKTSDSAVIKLLAKPNLVALNLLDTVGVRFVTRNLFDAFHVVRFLSEYNVISFPHIIPDQSANTLYPLNIFLEIMKELDGQSKEFSSGEVEEVLQKRLLEAEKRAEYKLKENTFSSKSYRFIKFINRKLVTIPTTTIEGKQTDLRFFYPYEIQVMDYKTHLNSISGPAAHDKYKERQKRAARRRVFGLVNESEK